MDQNQLKRLAAEAAIDYVEDDTIVGVGTGSTVNFFIDALARIKARISGAVSSSVASAEKLKALGVPRVVLMSAAANAEAQKLFEKLGFRRTMVEMTRES